MRERAGDVLRDALLLGHQLPDGVPRGPAERIQRVVRRSQLLRPPGGAPAQRRLPRAGRGRVHEAHDAARDGGRERRLRAGVQPDARGQGGRVDAGHHARALPDRERARRRPGRGASLAREGPRRRGRHAEAHGVRRAQTRRDGPAQARPLPDRARRGPPVRLRQVPRLGRDDQGRRGAVVVRLLRVPRPPGPLLQDQQRSCGEGRVRAGARRPKLALRPDRPRARVDHRPPRAPQRVRPLPRLRPGRRGGHGPQEAGVDARGEGALPAAGVPAGARPRARGVARGAAPGVRGERPAGRPAQPQPAPLRRLRGRPRVGRRPRRALLARLPGHVGGAQGGRQALLLRPAPEAGVQLGAPPRVRPRPARPHLHHGRGRHVAAVLLARAHAGGGACTTGRTSSRATPSSSTARP